MNKKIIFLLLLLQLKNIKTTNYNFYTPEINFPKNVFEGKNLNIFKAKFIISKAIDSFNLKNQTVPLLQLYGPENLLIRFINKNLDYTNTASAGNGFFKGIYTAKILYLSHILNFKTNFFIKSKLYFSENSFTQIELIPLIPINSKCKTPTELLSIDTNLNNYINKINSIVDKNFNFPINQAAIIFGATKSFQDFNTIDFLDLTFSIGINNPNLNLKPNFNSIFHPNINKPLNNFLNFEINTSIGLFDWITLGGSCICSKYFNKKTQYPLNINGTANYFLQNHISNILIEKKPSYYFNCFFEADHFIAGLSFLIGVEFQSNGKIALKTENPFLYAEKNINKNSNLSISSNTTFHFELEIDCAKNFKKNSPTLKFIFSKSISGKNSLKKTNCGAELNFYYNF